MLFRHACIQKITHAFTDVGFVYLVNHGIPRSRVHSARETAKNFFNAPESKKSRFTRKGAAADGSGSSNNGWVRLGSESLNPERPGDYKECFNITTEDDMGWPDELVTEFSTEFTSFYQSCSRVASVLLQMMALGLKQDVEEFSKMHSFNKEIKNATTLRCLYYPPITEKLGLAEGQVRCGEHTDYGSITLLFQDSVGGLEVCSRDGQFVPATPIEDSIIVNVGDLMQRWTADKLVSTKHRVLIPPNELTQSTSRMSMAFFVHPDDECVIRCTDGSEKYPAVTSWQYLQDRFNATY